MFCFAKICRICLNASDSKLIKLNNLDYDKIRIREKLKFCIPEAMNEKHLPELICIGCCKNLRRSYSFKQMCLQNKDKLNKYASTLLVSKRHKHGNLSIGLVDFIEKNQVALKTSDDMPIPKNLNESVSMHTISLNQWDLFETKFTCRCIKEYSSFTEETRHLCKSCEGDLLGFQLSKVKVGMAENRFNSCQSSSERVGNSQQSEVSCEYSCSESMRSSLESPSLRNKNPLNSPNTRQIDTNATLADESSNQNDANYDYSDVLMCKMKVSNAQNEVNMLRSVSYRQYNDRRSEPSDAENNSANQTFDLEKKHKCPLCEKKYTRQYDLFRHYKKHKVPFIRCVQCTKQYMRQEDLDKHIRKSHKGKQRKSIVRKEITRIFVKEQHDIEPNNIETNVNCTVCNETFENQTHLAVHLMTHKKEFKCKKCDKEFLQKEKLTEHLLTHSLPRIYQCSYCSKSFNYSSNLKRHMRVHTPSNKRDTKNNKDKRNNGTKKTKSHDENIDQNHTQEIVLYDPKIASNQKRGKTSSKSLEIALYTPLKSPTPIIDNVFNYATAVQIGDYACVEKDCKQSFAILKQYYRHLHDHNTLRSKADRKPYRCVECGKLCVQISTLYNHMLVHPSGKNKINHLEPKGMRFTCKYCRKGYNYIKHFNHHVAKHKSIKAEALEDSELEPNDMDDVKTELMDENDNDEIQNATAQTYDSKEFACVQCDKSYTTKQSLKRHMLAHPKQTEKYSCSICFEQFLQLGVLEEHILTHSKRSTEEWICEVCNKAFMQKANLKRHMMVHERPLICHHCRGRFDNKNDLVKHIMKYARAQYCKLCKLEFSIRTDMEKHMLEDHTNSKDYYCNVCFVNFENAEYFRKHVVIHPQKLERKYECAYCEKTYPTKSGLIRHNLSHKS